MKKLVIPLLLVLVAFVFFKLFYLADNKEIELQDIDKPELLPANRKKQPDITQNNTVNSPEKKTVVLKDSQSTIQQENTKKISVVVTQVQLGKTNKSGYAFIAYNGAAEQVYPVGAKLAEGVILKSLLADGVMVDNHGVLEKHKLKPSLLMKKSKTQDKPTSSEPPPLSDVKKELLPPQGGVNSIPPMGIPKEQSQSYQKHLELEAKKAEVEKMKREAVPPMGDPPMPEGGENFPPPN